MLRIIAKIVLSSFLIIGLASCKEEQPVVEQTEDEILQQILQLPAEPFNYENLPLPAHYSNQFIRIQDNTPINNRVTNWGATLGRVLFYDNRLSINNTISCASCHKQQFGFTDTAKFSKGFNGGFTERHSMALANATFYINGRFFWDERAETLEEQVLMPVKDPVEMGMQLDTLVNRLKQTKIYPILFNKAFGNNEITEQNIANALAQFIRSMVSYQSKYDVGLTATGNRNADFPNFTEAENVGKSIFMTNMQVNCFGCHNTDAFITDNARNNGLYLVNKDGGVFSHTQNIADMGKFKAPSLKNVALRVNFMHDGSVKGLDAVLEHYNSNIQDNSNLDSHLKLTGTPARMNLNKSQLNALKAFLETLTDHKFISDEKYSNPFK